MTGDGERISIKLAQCTSTPEETTRSRSASLLACQMNANNWIEFMVGGMYESPGKE